MFITVFLTVLSGVLVFVLGQIFSKFFIEPIYEQKEIKGKISDALIFYANLYTNPKLGNEFDRPKERGDATLLFRNLACELVSKTHMIPCYKYLSILQIVTKRKNIFDAHHDLIGLSNSMYPSDHTQTINNSRYRDNLEKTLNLMTK